tara:strand:- start:3 stop:656 length:654 start_codon:yes stop_codon:yes gene_type:complete
MVYHIGEHSFNTKKDAYTYTKALLIKNENNNIKKGDDIFEYLMEMIYIHPESSEKIGDGISSFDIIRDCYRNIALKINQHTLKDISVSWTTICSFKPRTKQSLLNDAFRNAINYQILEFRNNKLKNNKILECELCKSTFIINIDHIIQFKQLTIEFLALTNLKTPTEYDRSPFNKGCIFKLQDIEFKTEWDNYHKKHATLRPLCRTCNLKRPKYKSI